MDFSFNFEKFLRSVLFLEQIFIQYVGRLFVRNIYCLTAKYILPPTRLEHKRLFIKEFICTQIPKCKNTCEFYRSWKWFHKTLFIQTICLSAFHPKAHVQFVHVCCHVGHNLHVT